MSKKAQGSIKLLLDAEQRASDIVREARKNRISRLKQAREEADKEILKYRQQREKQFLKYREEHLGSGRSIEYDDLERRKQQAINEINHRVREKKGEVSDFLVKFVVQVDINYESNTTH